MNVLGADWSRTLYFWFRIFVMWSVILIPATLPLIPLGPPFEAWVTVYAFVLSLAYAFAVLWLVGGDFWKTVTRFKPGIPGAPAPIPPMVHMMAGAAGVKIKKYHEVPGWLNAAARIDGSLVVGSRIWTDLTKSEAHAVIGHEIGHLKDFQSGRVVLMIGLVLLSIPLMALPAMHFPALISMPSVLSSALLLMWSYSWYLERRADRFSAGLFGSAPMIFALVKLWKIGSDADYPSMTHPSLESRITRLRRSSRRQTQR